MSLLKSIFKTSALFAVIALFSCRYSNELGEKNLQANDYEFDLSSGNAANCMITYHYLGLPLDFSEKPQLKFFVRSEHRRLGSARDLEFVELFANITGNISLAWPEIPSCPRGENVDLWVPVPNANWLLSGEDAIAAQHPEPLVEPIHSKGKVYFERDRMREVIEGKVVALSEPIHEKFVFGRIIKSAAPIEIDGLYYFALELLPDSGLNASNYWTFEPVFEPAEDPNHAGLIAPAANSSYLVLKTL